MVCGGRRQSPALRQLHPGYIRDGDSKRGDSYANLVSNWTAREPTFYNGDKDAHNRRCRSHKDWPSWNDCYVYSIHELFDLSSQVGSRPWITIPVTLLDQEYNALGSRLASFQATYNFPEVLVEFGNGDGSGACGGVCFKQNGNFSQAAYATVANRAFGLIQAAAGSRANLRYVGSAQWVDDPPTGANAQ
jgi:hypothetical protein